VGAERRRFYAPFRAASKPKRRVKSPAEQAITHARPVSEFAFLALFQYSDLPPVGIALVIGLLVLSLGIHEAAHGWVALQCGDTTARDLGRITLNPIAHIDPVMTILVPTVCFLVGGFFFGGAKPVPVNYHRLRNPLRDMALVAIAGPLSNFLLAGFFLFCAKVVVEQLQIWGPESLGATVLGYAITTNLVLAAFNMLPIPPLDGSRVMTWLLPTGLREPYQAMERFGLILVIVAIRAVPAVQELVWSTVRVMQHGIQSLVSLGGRW